MRRVREHDLHVGPSFDELPDEFRQALSGARPGTLVGPVQTFGGFYILLGQAQRNQDNWVADIARYEAMQQGEARYRLPYLEQFRSAALGMPRRTPWIDGSIEKELFGSSHSVAR